MTSPGFAEQIEARGIRPVFVHLGSPERAKPYFDYYHLSDVERVSNPEGSLYASSVFQVPRKNVFTQIPRSRGLERPGCKGAVQKHGIGMIKEDANQMPAIFYLQKRAIVRAYRYRTIADQPDYLKLIA